jgi:hypothetical protein
MYEGNQNIRDWCRHLYSSYGSAEQRYIVGLVYLVSQCAICTQLAGRGKFSHPFNGEAYDFYSASAEYYGNTLIDTTDSVHTTRPWLVVF